MPRAASPIVSGAVVSGGYRPDGRVLSEFLRDGSHVAIVQGPIGSGKTTAAIMRCYRHMIEQRPGRDGVRRTRWVVVRNTFPELEQTTLKTWCDWFPEGEGEGQFGRLLRSRPYRYDMRFRAPDGRLCEAEVWFLALDEASDVRKLRSLEVTGFYFNELQFVSRELVDDAESRTGRYPSRRDGGATWDGVIADMNAPSEGHWVPYMRGDLPPPDWMAEGDVLAFRRPPSWSFFVQPPGLVEVRDADGLVTGYVENPAAENRRWLKPGYYEEKAQGKSKAWIDVNILNRVGLQRAGKAVWPMFSTDRHVASGPLAPNPDLPLYVGVDFGRTPTAVFGQASFQRWRILGELGVRDMGAVTFAPILRRYLAQHFGGLKVLVYGDPSGDFKGQSDERTPFMILRAAGIPIQPAPSNDLSVRLQAVEGVLTRMTDGEPSFLLSPRCVALKAAMAGGYHFRPVKGADRYVAEPEKNSASHYCDALQYMLLGGGEGRYLLTGGREVRPVQTRVPYSVWRGAPKSGRFGTGRGGGAIRGW